MTPPLSLGSISISGKDLTIRFYADHDHTIQLVTELHTSDKLMIFVRKGFLEVYRIQDS